MKSTLQSLVPMVHVANVQRSIEFYTKLGFEIGNTFTPEGAASPRWAWLQSEGGAKLMVAKASEPVDPKQQAVLFYIYCDDVAAKRSELVAANIKASPITSPFYAPRGEFRIEDPDGYVLMVTHA